MKTNKNLSIVKPVSFGDYGMSSSLNKKGIMTLLDSMEQDFSSMEEDLFTNGEMKWDIFDDTNWSNLVMAIKDIRDYIEDNTFIDIEE